MIRTIGQNLKKRAEQRHVEVDTQLISRDNIRILIERNEQATTNISLNEHMSNSTAERLADLKRELSMLKQQQTTTEISVATAKTAAISAFKKAIDAQRNSLESMSKILGVHQPETLEAMSDLARTIQRAFLVNSMEFLVLMGQADQLLRSALKYQLRIHKQEVDHEDVLSAKTLLAAFYHQQERYEQAENLEMQVLLGERAKHGDNHVRSLAALQALAETLAAQNTSETWRMAVGYLEKCVEGSLLVLGEDQKEYKDRAQLLAIWKTNKMLSDGSASSQRSIRIMQHYERSRATRPSTILETPRYSMSRGSKAPQFQEASFNEELIRNLRISSMYQNHGLTKGLEDHESPFLDDDKDDDSGSDDDEENDTILSGKSPLHTMDIRSGANNGRHRHKSTSSKKDEYESLFEMDY